MSSQEIKIKSCKGITFYFLSIVSISLVIAIIYLIINLFTQSIDRNNYILLIGSSLFAPIVIGVTIYEKKNYKLNINYPNENQIKVNNKIYDIDKKACYIDIIIDFYNVKTSDGISTNSYIKEFFLEIKENEDEDEYKYKNKTIFKITKGREELFSNFIYNFEYELSDFKKKQSEFIKAYNNALEEKYDKGHVSQETLNKIKLNKY